MNFRPLGEFAGKAWRSARAVDNTVLRILAMLTVAWWIALISTVAVIIYIGLLPLMAVTWILDGGWSNYLTLEEYWGNYPTCRTGHGTRCRYCGSGSIWQRGWRNQSDDRRIHYCNQCQKMLYRTRR